MSRPEKESVQINKTGNKITDKGYDAIYRRGNTRG